nr:TonB-dependent receptor [Candidatus Neomarinimicrobiota bacterium]
TLRYYSLSTVADGPVNAPPTLRIPDENTSLHNQYEQRPFEASIYLQDKIEFDELILNAGLRYD